MKDIKIAIIGLGYVGLPLARLFATKYNVVGFDINEKRINELNQGKDLTLEVDEDALQSVLKKDSNNNDNGLICSSNIEDIKDCNYYVITVPTPIDKNNRPDLTPLYKSSETVAKVLKKDDIVIYESTVYPGVTEDECVPVLEKISGLKFNKDCKNNQLIKIGNTLTNPVNICNINSMEDLIDDNQIIVFPNPTNDYFSIQNNSRKANDYIISITNIQGKLIKRFKLNNENKKIDISSFEKGVYFVKIETPTSSILKKIVKL